MWPDFAADAVGLSLLHGARDHPDEADRRLILADWLDDRGEDLVAHLLRESLRCDGWITFPGVARERWRPWNGCWHGWLGIQVRVGLVLLRELPDSPWLCVLDLSYLGPRGLPRDILQTLRGRVVHVLDG